MACSPSPPHSDSLTSNYPPSLGTILVVDDEPGLRTLLEIVLTRGGYRVFVAANGQEAIRVYQSRRESIDAVLLDVRMPELDGPRTLAELQRMRPDLPCCFLSGHLGAYEGMDLRALGARAFLDKPFRPEVLLEVVASLVPQTVVG